MIRRYLWVLPILLLASGPPTWREGWERGALATLENKYDAWILFQIAVYALAGSIAAFYLVVPLRRGGLNSRHGATILLALALFFLCAFSSLWSPAVLPTLVMAVFLGISMVVIAQFASYGSRTDISAVSLLEKLQLLAILIVLLVLLTYQLFPTKVSYYDLGKLRVRGGRVGVISTVAPISILISLYFIAFQLRWWVPQLCMIVIGLVSIYLAQTRSAYVITALAMFVVWAFWMMDSLRRANFSAARLYANGMVTLAAILGMALAGGFFQGLWYRGHPEAVSTFSQRTTIWSWAADHVNQQPFGFGYATGFRYIFQNMDPVVRYGYLQRGLEVAAIGEAHNSYLEVLVGVGWPGFIISAVLVLLIAFSLFRAFRLSGFNEDIKHGTRLTAVMLFMFLIDGMVTSSYTLPARQPFGFLIFAIGMALLLEVRVYNNIRTSRAARIQPNPATIASGPAGAVMQVYGSMRLQGKTTSSDRQ